MAKILLHPYFCSSLQVAVMEYRLGRIAIIRGGYIEMMTAEQVAKLGERP